MEESTRVKQTENKESIIAKVQKFMQDGCGCRRGLKSSQCSDQFTEETVLDNLYNCLELSHVELDLVVLANVQAFTAIEVIGEKRKRSPPYSFLYRSQPICKEPDVSEPLRHQQIPVLKACGPLSKSWYFSANIREQQETTT